MPDIFGNPTIPIYSPPATTTPNHYQNILNILSPFSNTYRIAHGGGYYGASGDSMPKINEYLRSQNIPNWDVYSQSIRGILDNPDLSKDIQEAQIERILKNIPSSEKNIGGYSFSDLSSQISRATDPNLINQLYNTMAGNISERSGQQRAGAQRAAAEFAASRNLANPGAFVTSAGSEATAPYAQAFGGLEAQRAGQLQQAGTQQFNMNYMLNRAQQGDTQAAQQLMLALQGLGQQQQYLDLYRQRSTPGTFDYLTMLGGATAPWMKYLLFPSLLP